MNQYPFWASACGTMILLKPPTTKFETSSAARCTSMATRTEVDALGPVEVPAEAYWGAQTTRAVDHFGHEDLLPREVIRALALVKKVVAGVNWELGLLD